MLCWFPTTAIIWGRPMLRSRHIDKIVLAVTVLFVIAAILLMNGRAIGLALLETPMGYEERLFDNTKVHTIDIVMDDWDGFIASATSEEYYDATLVIDGETFKNTAIRGKGNTSLSMVSSMDSERYSFKVEFDHYDDALSYHGLDKLSLNNLIQDATMMKDYLAYTLMKEAGAAAPLCSFVYITVNGEDWGLYLAVEGIEESFLERNFGADYGELYKPDSTNMGEGRENGRGFNMEDAVKRETRAGESAQKATEPQMPEVGDIDISKMPEGFDPSQISAHEGGAGGRGAADVKLQYIDDNVDSYANIWNNAKTAVTPADQTRLIQSLKKLSSGEDIESVVDVDAVIRYFVVHNYVCNGDSYTGSMIHNYYLYEKDGKMTMLPWDYNLAFGSFQGGNAQSAVNTPIDSPVSGGEASDRPMWNWIAADETYTAQYHQYYEEFLNTVPVEGIIENAYTLIRPYVASDPTAFYTAEEFEKGVEALRRFCTLRSESIAMQLANGETVNNMNYVDASGLTLSDMGSMGRGNMPDMGDRENRQTEPNLQTGAQRPARDDMPNRGQMPAPGQSEAEAAGKNSAGWLWIAGSALILAAGILIAKRYKR